jgi:diguanylate cyclase (GGDEF)-like protein/PAS domain S-box-containing protein
MDTPAEEEFDELACLAAEVCGVPISLISLVDDRRLWFKAVVGTALRETAREGGFCTYAMEQEGLFVVEDAGSDERFAENPLVVGDPKIRFYAGMPVRSPCGHAVGTLCVMDTVPRSLTESQRNALKVLARQVKARIELRMQRRAMERSLEEKERVAAGLRASEERFRLFMNNSPFASFIKDAEGRYLFYNKVLAECFGVDTETWLGRTDAEIWPEEVAKAFREHDMEVLRTGKTMVTAEQTRDAAGVTLLWRSFKFPYEDERGNMLLAGVAVDVTEEMKAKAELEEATIQMKKLATTDLLTGMKNRRAFEERLAVEFSRARRKKRQLAVMMLDVDDFKKRNDTWGHAAGDAVLRKLAAILESTVRLTDLAARYGGEEFVVLLTESGAESSLELAHRLKNNIAAEEWEYEPLTVSIGIAGIEDSMLSGDELVKAADDLLYAAKRAGKNCVLVNETAGVGV